MARILLILGVLALLFIENQGKAFVAGECVLQGGY